MPKADRFDRMENRAPIPAARRADLNDYERGWIEGVSLYSWWKDGTRYVGTTGRTFREAVLSFLHERGLEPGAAKEYL